MRAGLVRAGHMVEVRASEERQEATGQQSGRGGRLVQATQATAEAGGTVMGISAKYDISLPPLSPPMISKIHPCSLG